MLYNTIICCALQSTTVFITRYLFSFEEFRTCAYYLILQCILTQFVNDYVGFSKILGDVVMNALEKDVM